MRWKNSRRSRNVENRRGVGGKTIIGGGGTMFAIAAVVFFLGGDPTPYLMEGVQKSISYNEAAPLPKEKEQEYIEFTSSVLAGTEDVWRQKFSEYNYSYKEPRLILFSGSVNSACGGASAAVGPFYCPLDQQVYLDLSFFEDLKNRYGAAGDFAQAYVIAHEVGHHVQTILGLAEQNMRQRQRSNKVEANRLSVEFELQADCLSGIWALNLDKTGLALEEGDIEEALNAASQIGDDTLQKKSSGRVVPDSFTHGSAAQRQNAFMTGFRQGSFESCGIL